MGPRRGRGAHHHVSNHVNNMEKKLHVRHRGQLVLYAAQQGLTIK